jgi:molybdopterin synthase sulfur carrier subunit
VGAAPNIVIHVPGMLRQYCGGAVRIPLAASTVQGALEFLEQEELALYRNVCDETGHLRRHLNVFVNADNTKDLDGVATRLRSGDVLTILPAVSGG